MEFYEILSEIMEEKNMSIADVAKKCNLTDSTVRSLYFKFRFRHRLQAGYIISYPVVPPCCRAFTRSFPVYIMPVISAYR